MLSKEVKVAVTIDLPTQSIDEIQQDFDALKKGLESLSTFNLGQSFDQLKVSIRIESVTKTEDI